ncbi:type II-A CRISPR-associated protein Csn2 [Pediococcus acidilactici]
MKLTYRTHEPVELKPQAITVLGTNNPTVYTDLVNGMQERNELILAFDENYKELEVSKVFDWVGDVGTQDLVIQKYSTKIERVFAEGLVDEQRNQIHDQVNQLFNTVAEQLFMLDLPISVNYDFDLKKLLKYCGVHFDPLSAGNPYGIIEAILKIHEECAINSCVVLTNVAHYLTATQIEELTQLVSQTNQALLLIEFTEIGNQEAYGNSEFYYIDNDFVDWHR